MAGETEEVDVPPTLQALLAARLDQLDPPERAVLERGAVEGELFHRGAVQALAPEETQLTPRLAGLTRKDLIRPDRAQLPGDDGFRFRHLLIRDAAYEALPKATRAELHRRFADWLAERGGLVELDEVLGYHLEQAGAYARELGLAEQSEQLARGAAERLRAAGERAAGRGDASAAVNLLARAAALLPSDDPVRRELRVELAFALIEHGELREARTAFAEVLDEAHAAGEEVVEWRARIGVLAAEVWLNEREMAVHTELVLAAIPALERLGDELGLARAWFLVGLTSFWQGRSGDEAFARAVACARHAGSGRDEAQILIWMLISSWFGSMPAREALARCREVLEGASSRQVEAVARIEQGALLALSGSFDEARRSWQDGVAILEELGLPLLAAGMSQERFDIEWLAGDLAAAEAVLRQACDVLQKLGEKGFLSTRAGYLGLCLVMQGRPAEAEPFLELALEAMSDDSSDVVNIVELARAADFLLKGSLVEAEEHARKAVDAIAGWEMPKVRGDSLVVLGDVLAAAGRTEEGVAVYSEALALYEQKENLVGATRVSQSLAGLEPAAGASEP